MVIFGKNAFVNASIHTGDITLDAKVDPFKIGDYTISGASDIQSPSTLKLRLSIEVNENALFPFISKVVADKLGDISRAVNGLGRSDAKALHDYFVSQDLVEFVSQRLVELTQILESLTITEVHLKANYGKSSGKLDFAGDIRGAVFDQPFLIHLSFEFNPQEFLQALYDEYAQSMIGSLRKLICFAIEYVVTFGKL
jgi:hypothetical protein